MNDTERMLLIDLLGTAPARLLSPPSGGGIELPGEVLRHGDYPFPVCADLLVDPETRELCGLTFSFRVEFVQAIGELFAGLGGGVVRFVSVSTPIARSEDPIPTYASLATPFEPYAHLDIIWAMRLGLDTEMAQLGIGEVSWWYGTGGTGRPMAVGVQNIDRLLMDFGLTLPLG